MSPPASLKIEPVSFSHAAAQSSNSLAAWEFGKKFEESNPAIAKSVTINDLEQVEITTIRRVLDACGGNVSSASKQLKISRNTIYRRLNKVS